MKYYFAGRVFDGMEFRENGAIVSDDETGTIIDSGSEKEVERPKECVDLSSENCTLLPGLVDAHVHFFGTNTVSVMDWNIIPETTAVLRSVRDLKNLLLAGFTAVREMGSKGGPQLRKAVEEGYLEGPTIYSCGRSLAQTGGNDDATSLPLHIAQELSYSYYCDSPWEARKAVRLVMRDGANFVKVYTQGSTDLGRRIIRHLTVEELEAIVDEAHSVGLRVAAHAIGKDSLSNALEARVDTIDHGMGLTEEICSKMEKQGVYYVPTLSIMTLIEEMSKPETKALIKQHFTKDLELAKKYNLKITAGTDAVASKELPHGQNYKEIAYLAKAMGNRGALVAATKNGAGCLGMKNAGQLKKGFRADMVVFKGNPERDIEVLNPRNVRAVLKQGRLYKPESRS